MCLVWWSKWNFLYLIINCTIYSLGALAICKCGCGHWISIASITSYMVMCDADLDVHTSMMHAEQHIYMRIHLIYICIILKSDAAAHTHTSSWLLGAQHDYYLQSNNKRKWQSYILSVRCFNPFDAYLWSTVSRCVSVSSDVCCAHLWDCSSHCASSN